jgi:hypothetical protein
MSSINAPAMSMCGKNPFEMKGKPAPSQPSRGAAHLVSDARNKQQNQERKTDKQQGIGQFGVESAWDMFCN